jgi:aryl-alcohol dehydrogenase-like predicted oxidoreductase
MSAQRYTRREAARLAGGALSASVFLPFSGRYSVFARPAGKPLQTRVLGRTGREVTTFGLAGGNAVMWDLPGEQAVETVVKAVRMGVTYLETANNYQLSQLNYGKAFRILNLIPGQPGYDASLRAKLFLATKSGLRHAIVRDGSRPMGRSAGGGTLVLDDLRRSLTQFFGDGKGYIPEGAYIDLFQIHSLTRYEDVDAVFEGLDNPEDPSLPRVGALAALVDYRDGTNRTGLNPEHKKWIRHIGITGHENAAAHMYAIRKDRRNLLEALLVAINPNDRNYFSHQYNSVAAAREKGMGIIAMKLFADGVMYGLEKRYASQPHQRVMSVGRPGKVPYEDFIQYALSTPGVTCAIMGIGMIDKSNDPTRDQLVADIAACQLDGMGPGKRLEVEQRVADQHGTDTNFFQRPSSGLLAPEKFQVTEIDPKTARLSWSTAYAGAHPIDRYEIYRREVKLASIPYRPQLSEEPFVYEDRMSEAGNWPGGKYYKIRVVDAAGNAADTPSVKA